jgi:two-component system, probable response regulator PhcQ
MSGNKHYAILYVDDETIALKYFEKGFSQDFRVMTAPSAEEGWNLVQAHHREIGVLMTDQRMPGQSGVELLEKVRQHYPNIIRILVTAYSDIGSAIAAVNTGAIYKYISKPWDVNDLRITLLRALDYFILLNERDQLLREKLSVLQQIILSDRTKNLGVLASGLSSCYRNTLQAAARLVEAAPVESGDHLLKDQDRSSIGKNVGHALVQASNHTYRLALKLKELAEPSTTFSSQPASLRETLLRGDKNAATPPGLVLKMEDSLPPIKANAKQLGRMAEMLAANIQAMQGDAPREVQVSALSVPGPGEAKVQITFTDGSPDWTDEQKIRFFAPFSGLSADASIGLDLAVCYFIAHHHGGQIDVPGTSSAKVVVSLPVDPAKVAAAPMETSQLDRLFHYERKWEQFLKR